LSTEDDKIAQRKIIANFHQDLKDKLDARDSGDWEYIPYSRELRDADFEIRVQKDLTFAVFSVIFVFCFICFHTKSFFLGGMGMLLILSSFPISLVLCNK